MKTYFFFIFILLQLISKEAKPFTYSTKDSINYFINEYKYVKALDLIDKLIQKGDSTKEMWIARGSALKGLFNYDLAIKSYLHALSLDSLDNQANIELAKIYELLSDYNGSLKYFTQALKYDPNNVMLQIENANCLYYLDLHKQALVEYKKIYRNDTMNYFVIKRIASCCDKISQEDTAIYYFKKAMQINPVDANNILGVCNIYITQKKYIEGIAVSEGYRCHDSSNARINSQNAYLYQLNKDFKTSIIKFKKCLENKDTTKFVFKNIGIDYCKLGEIPNFDTAKYYLEKAYYMDTTDITTLNFLGISCSKSYYKELGVFYLEKATQLYTPFLNEYSIVYRNLVEVCRTWDKYPCNKLLPICLKAYDLNPRDSLLSYYIAYEYDICMADKGNAMLYYRKFLETRPTKGKTDESIQGYYEMAEYRLKEIKKEYN
jgi:tetratricopeptide (TPR) repeat protein